MVTINLKNVQKGVAIGLLGTLGIIGTDIGIDQIQVNKESLKTARNYYATQCWRDTGLQWSELGLMSDIFNAELKEMPILVSNMLIGVKQKEGLRKFCKMMIKL